MKLIAHRGLYQGPNKTLENKPEQITEAIALGFDCEVDLRLVDNQLWLGHDNPQYLVTEEFIRQPGLWIHAKNLEALEWLSNRRELTYFWHEEDSYTITSNGYIWTFPENKLTPLSIRLMPEWNNANLNGIENTDCFGICSDYVELIKLKFETAFQRNIVLDIIG